jgi:hypothetical protein
MGRPVALFASSGGHEFLSRPLRKKVSLFLRGRWRAFSIIPVHGSLVTKLHPKWINLAYRKRCTRGFNHLCAGQPHVRNAWKTDIHSSCFSATIGKHITGPGKNMYRITLECEGVPPSAGDETARDITEAFRCHYPHEHNVLCTFDNGKLKLVAENDYDAQGLSLMDEFSDNISAYIAELFDGEIKLVSVESTK